MKMPTFSTRSARTVSMCWTIARNVLEGCLRLVDQLIDREFRGLAIELPQFVAPLPFPLRKLVHDVLEILFQGLDDGLNLAPLGLRPRIEFLGRHDLAVFGRRQRKSERRPQKHDVFFGGLVAQRGKRLALLVLEGLVDRAAARLIVFALEHRRQRSVEIVDQLMHRLVEFAARVRPAARSRPAGRGRTKLLT